MKLTALLAVLAIALPAAAQHQARDGGDGVVHVLPLGDSITQGGRADRDEFTYRLPLFEMLTEANVKFDFIGSLKAGLQGDAKWPETVAGQPFDLDHEGHYGWKTAAVRDKLGEWMASYPAAPDIVLVHLGTNDQDADPDAAVVAPLRDMIAMFRGRNPNVVVLVGHLNFNGGKAVGIRERVEAMATELNTPESPVLTVRHYEGWNENPEHPQADTFDWAHPNPSGQRKMAEKWLEAMRPYLGLAAE